MDTRCRLVLLQFVCLVWPSPPSSQVDSFVLRRRSAVDDDDHRLADALYAVERFQRPPAVSYLDPYDGILPTQNFEDYDMDNDSVAKDLPELDTNASKVEDGRTCQWVRTIR